MTINRFISNLAAYQGVSTFNPYSDKCDDFDRHDAAEIRRSNLRTMIKAALAGKAATLWVARDLGYRGGRRTGLALTDEAHLSHASQLLGGASFRKATKGPTMAERTATVMWSTLIRIEEPVMLWNVFPFHPHNPDDPMSNRSHTSRERDEARPFLDALIELLSPKKVIAVGRDAERAVEDLKLPVERIRHPSYGGQTEFVSQVEALYRLEPVRPPVNGTLSLQ